MSSKRKVPAGIKAISEFFSPVPPKVNRREQQSLQEENVSTSEKSATSVPENTSSLEGNNNAAPIALENVLYVKNLNLKLKSIQEMVWFHLLGGVVLIQKRN